MTESDPLPGRRWPVLAGVAAVGIAIVLVLTGGLSLLIGGEPTPSASPASTSTPGPEGFPSEVLGMPVVTIGDAVELLASGADGRDIAVAGYWVPTMAGSCGPPPNRFFAPLEGHCNSNVFAVRPFRTCHPFGNDGVECTSGGMPPGVQSPLDLGGVAHMDVLGRAAGDPLTGTGGGAAVLIGHVGDARLWQCPADGMQKCGRQFVIDRVVWVAGEWLDLAPSGASAATRLTLEQAASEAGIDTAVISATVMSAQDLPTVDPRLHAVGHDLVWVLRSLGDQPADGDDPSRAVNISVVDDGSGEVTAESRQEMSEGYEPARLLVQATMPGIGPDDVVPYYRVEGADGAGIQDMEVGGVYPLGDGPLLRRGPGFPIVLEPGDYVVRVWRANIEPDESSGPPQDECSTPITVAALDELRVEAAFPAAGRCTFVAPTFETALTPEGRDTQLARGARMMAV